MVLNSRYVPEPLMPAMPVPDDQPRTFSAGIAFMKPTIVLFPTLVKAPQMIEAMRLSMNPSVSLTPSS